MDRSRKKSLFLRREKDVWDRLAQEKRRREELEAQLAAARQEVAELTRIRQVLADLRIKEAEARIDAQEARENLVALLERTRVDEAEDEWLRKERDDLLQTVEGFCMECELAH